MQLVPTTVPCKITVVPPLLVFSPAERDRSAVVSPQQGSFGGGPLVTMEVMDSEIISTRGAVGGAAAADALPPPSVNLVTYLKIFNEK